MAPQVELPQSWMNFSMENTPVRSSTDRPYSACLPLRFFSQMPKCSCSFLSLLKLPALGASKLNILPPKDLAGIQRPTYFYSPGHQESMTEKTSERKIALKISPEMEEYIRARSTDQRVATTCEGPLMFSIKTSPPKPTDHVIVVGDRRVFVSAVQMPYIKAIDAAMLPRCALEKRGQFR